MRLFDMANDSGLFRSRAELEATGWTLDRNHFQRGEEEMLPLFEAKMAHLFDHRFGTYEGATQAHYNKGFLPRFTDGDHQDCNRFVLPDSWVESKEVNARLEGRDARNWFLGWRDITRRTEMRTVVACIIPKAAIGHTMPLMFSDAAPAQVAMLYANLCSFVLDYTARQKVGGAHLTYNYLKQLPVLPPSTYSAKAPWSLAMTLCDWMLPRVIELTYTAWDLEAFAADVGHHGPPFRWDPARRELLRAELDAAFFHLYGLSPGDVAYVMETFPIVKRTDEKEHEGDYHTKCLILEAYESLAEATRTGRPHVTPLDLPLAIASTTPSGTRVGQPVVQPRPALRSLPRDTWRRPSVDQAGETGAALAAVLKAFGTPTLARAVRLAAILAMEPRLVLPSLAHDESIEWRRLVGPEAAPTAAGIIELVPKVNHLLGSAVVHLRANGVLVEDSQMGTWAPGPTIDDIYTDGWPDGRAGYIVEMLRRRGELEVANTLPALARRWIDGTAA